MPHCIIEYSEDLSSNVDEISSAVLSGARDSQLFDERDIKIRALSFSKYTVGVSDDSFVHVSSKILSGRSSGQKLQLNTCIVERIKELKFNHCSITAEVIDIDRDSYSKFRA